MAETAVLDAVKAASVEEKLADHLRLAEDHLIEAVKLFELKSHPDRTHDYVSRLTRAQELVTTLYREELIRIRGPLKKLAATAGTRKK